MMRDQAYLTTGMMMPGAMVDSHGDRWLGRA
jgi:hypothetical protein